MSPTITPWGAVISRIWSPCERRYTKLSSLRHT